MPRGGCSDPTRPCNMTEKTVCSNYKGQKCSGGPCNIPGGITMQSMDGPEPEYPEGYIPTPN